MRWNNGGGSAEKRSCSQGWPFATAAAYTSTTSSGPSPGGSPRRRPSQARRRARRRGWRPRLGRRQQRGRVLRRLAGVSAETRPAKSASSPLYTTHLDPKGENGPAGSVRVEVQIAHRDTPDDRSVFHKEEFWLQPKYGYAVVKHVYSDCPAVDEDPRRKEKELVYEYDDFRQTPRGLWYPTVSRCKNAIQSENKNKPGGIEFHDQVTYFYVDFTAELPDELFNTDWHGDSLAGIHFAQRDEKPTSNDLGKIRPPGGVPLFPSGAARLPCRRVDAATKRLEAAPAKDLDKWVAELERLTDKKPEGWVEQQGWRTEFVSRVSVAFDGLKWNAKSADNLFQRAQDHAVVGSQSLEGSV